MDSEIFKYIHCCVLLLVKFQKNKGAALKSCDKREFCQSRLNTTQIPVRSHFPYAVERCQKQ